MSRLNFESLILHEDEDFLLLAKPPFVSSLDDRHEAQSIIGWLREHRPGAQLGHRLDKETSGVIAAAKHPEAYRHLSMRFEHRQVLKVYHALCDGVHEFEELLVSLPLRILRSGQHVRVDKSQGKEAETYVNTKQAFRTHTLVECLPLTGRMHQIRVHMAALAAPLAGDEQYGGQPFLLSRIKARYNLGEDVDERPLMGRVGLHAWKLSFEGLKGQLVEAQSPYPKDFAAALRQLERWASK